MRVKRTANPLRSFLENQGTVIVDGGLATELEARGHDLDHELWSARLLLEEPQAIRQIHRDYLAAGADCIISASYQATIPGFMRQGLSAPDARALLELSVKLAVETRDQFWSVPANRIGRLKPLVAASVGPYGAALADGSEYRGDYNLDEAGLQAFHRQRWELLAQSAVDLLACETIPSWPETRALARLLAETPGRYAWFSFSCPDEIHISDGTPIARCAAFLDDNPGVAAIGINCTAPRYIAGLVREVRRVTDRPIVVYPNSGERYNLDDKRWLGEKDVTAFAELSHHWHAAGAQVVGGCCRTGPAHIAELRDSLVVEA
ncbi:MAG: homocysteine S-methyltransferase [Candidatus Promineifilaceae bacterium]|nr:homocysteine S-methyltransferase [Candidatus Promineifilaceae bacterium]